LAQVLILVSTRRVPSRRTSAWLLLTPLTSAVLAMTLLGEAPTTFELLGGALVIAGILGASGAGESIVRALAGRQTGADPEG
jgi:drug/metabolite transporter (DMT)-like permease